MLGRLWAVVPVGPLPGPPGVRPAVGPPPFCQSEFPRYQNFAAVPRCAPALRPRPHLLLRPLLASLPFISPCTHHFVSRPLLCWLASLGLLALCHGPSLFIYLLPVWISRSGLLFEPFRCPPFVAVLVGPFRLVFLFCCSAAASEFSEVLGLTRSPSESLLFRPLFIPCSLRLTTSRYIVASQVGTG